MHRRINQTLRTSVVSFVLLVTCALSLALGQTNSPLLLRINDPRPVARAAEQLQEALAVAINYEDPRYEHPSELSDVTATVARSATAGARVVVPRGGELKASVELPAAATSNVRSADELLGALANLLRSYSAAGNTTEYDADSANGMLYVYPKRTVKATGELAAVQPVMLTPISLPFQERSGAEMLQAIVEATSTACGYKIAVGMAPVAALMRTRVTMGASAQPARDVLAGLLAALSNSARPLLAYHLYFEPQSRFYMLNIRAAPVPAESPAPVPYPTPSSNSHWHRN